LTDLIPVSKYDVIPGFFRTTDYSYDEVILPLLREAKLKNTEIKITEKKTKNTGLVV
jgi:hypothetical protein